MQDADYFDDDADISLHEALIYMLSLLFICFTWPTIYSHASYFTRGVYYSLPMPYGHRSDVWFVLFNSISSRSYEASSRVFL